MAKINNHLETTKKNEGENQKRLSEESPKLDGNFSRLDVVASNFAIAVTQMNILTPYTT
jgi:hypothetical protein